MGEVVSDYLERGLVLVIADLLSLITVSSCLVIKVPQINTIRENESSKGESAAHAKSPKNTHLHQSLFSGQASVCWDYAWSCSATR